MHTPIEERAAGEIRPFIVTQVPIAGESLLGFVCRSLASTAVPRVLSGLQLAGVTPNKATFFPVTPASPHEINGLAALFGTDPEEIASRLYAPTSLVDSESKAISFFGTPVRAAYREYRWRRLSPRALVISNHHRASWDLRPLGFDPETLERLIHTCPECQQPLDWIHAMGISMCNHCVDERGFPFVDLREHPQPVVETDDPEALGLVARILSHDSAVQADAMTSIPAPWNELSPSEVAEAIFSIARILADNDEPKYATVRKAQREEMELPHHEVARASRGILNGHAGMADILQSTRQQRAKIVRGVHRSPMFELGQFMVINKDVHLSRRSKDLLREAIANEGKRLPFVREARWEEVLNDGRVPLGPLCLSHRVHNTRVQRLVDAGLISVAREGHRGVSVRVLPDEVVPILKRLPLMADAQDTASVLGVSQGCVELLAERGLISRACSATALVLGPHPFYKRKSAEDLVIRLVSKARMIAGLGGTSIFEAIGGSRRHSGRWGAAFAVLLEFAGDILKGDQVVDWRHNLRISDVELFLSAMDRVPIDLETVDADIVAGMLRTPRRKVEELGRQGILTPIPVVQNKVTFSRREVQDFADRYILSEEAADLFAIPSIRALHHELRMLRVHPVGAVNKCQIFDRQMVIAVVRAD